MATESYKIVIDGDWYDDLIRERIDEGNFEAALDLVRELTDTLTALSDYEREQLEMDIMNGTRHFCSSDDGTIGITDPCE